MLDMTNMKRWTRRLAHLDRMACNTNLEAVVRERFRIAAWELRRTLRRMA